MTNTTTALPNDVPNGVITFSANYLPPLRPGNYQISVQQDVSATGTGAFSESHTDQHNFAVGSDRFVLAEGDVQNYFPPPNGSGEYAGTLPHVILSRRTFAWERVVASSATNAPWLALLLFHPEDSVPPLQTVTVADLDRTAPNSKLSAGTVSYGDGDTNFGPQYGENWTDSCQVIDIPITTFSAIAPSLADLQWLAHARTVATQNKSGTPAETPGTFSVIVGNRLPDSSATGVLSTVHLVSLEGMGSYLPTESGTTYMPAPFPQNVQNIRLVSLLNWSYTSVDPKENFAQYLTDADRTAFQRPFNGMAGQNDPVAQAFGLGYTAFNHSARQGDTTVSWYRGPFVPCAVGGELTLAGPIYAPDQVVRYDPGSGMMDVSYAAAFELGRLMALANKSFSVALYRWRRGVKQVIAGTVTRDRAVEKFGGALDAPSLGALDASPPSEVGLSARQAMAAFIAQNLATVFAAGGELSRTNPAQLSQKITGASLAAAKAAPATGHGLLTKFRAMVADPIRVAAAAQSDASLPVAVTEWLAHLIRLEGVPLNYLIPDETFLPVESIRFFNVDVNWVYALLEGAFNVGVSSTTDAALDTALRPILHAAAKVRALTLRSAPTAADVAPKGTTDTNAATPLLYSGFLLRSAVVTGWPSLEADAYDNNGTLLPILHMTRLTSSILLYIVQGTLATVDIHEPHEALHFGVENTGGDNSSNVVALRYVTVPSSVSATPGSEIPSGDTFVQVSVPLRGATRLGIDALAQSLATTLQSNTANNNEGGSERAFTSAEFALQMVEGVGSVTFVSTTSSTSSGEAK